ncbi:UNVERIFIED_CONTAM: hypothetical protein HDU68_000207 [Siphonaria sp. JEL0065]|nr:hypothetical protein HDU68_000207 [Siphonaria sp. JEL0065]
MQETTTIDHLPFELLQEILKHLPLDTTILRNVVLSSAAFAASLVNVGFANVHIRACFRQSCKPNMWEFLDKEGIRNSKFLALPFSYKVGLFMELLIEEPWALAELVESMEDNLMYFERWRVDPELAMRIVTCLLERAVDITTQANRLFRWSSRAGYLDVVKLLLAHPDVDPADDDNYAIKTASETGETEVVRLLLADSRVDPTAENDISLQYACDFARVDVVKMLLADKRVDPSANEEYCLIRSCTLGHLEILDSLLKAGVDATFEENNALRHTCKEGYLSLTKLLLQDKRVDPAVLNNAPIRLAAQYGHFETTKLLLDIESVDPSDEDSSALALAAENGHLQVVKLLLADGRSDVNSFNGFSILTAARNGHWDVVELLLTAPEIEADMQENLLLLQAIEAENLDIIKKIIAHPTVDPAIGDQYALTVAAELGFDKVVDLLLLDPRVSPCVNGDLYPALDEAISRGHVDVVARLLQDSRVKVTDRIMKNALSLGTKNIVIVRMLHAAFGATDPGDEIYEDVLTKRLGSLEIRQEILLLLPIDSTILWSAALLNKLLFTDILLHSNSFPTIHFSRQLKVSHEPDIWEFLNTENIRDAKWLQLPFSYKLAIYRKLMVAIPWPFADDMDSMDHNLMFYNRWKMSRETSLRITKALVADPSFKVGSQDNRLFRWAARSGYMETVQLLLQHPGIDPSCDDNYAIKCASDSGHIELVRLLLTDPRIDPSAENCIALHYACDRGFPQIIELLLKDPRVDPTSDNFYALQRTCIHGHADILRILMQVLDPSSLDNIAILQASRNSHSEIVRLLLTDSRVNPSVQRNKALVYAVSRGDLEIARLLLAAERVHPANVYENLILSAVQRQNVEMVRLLVEDGRIDPCDNGGSLAMHLCTDRGDVEILKVLLEDPRVDAGVDDQYALQLAIRRGHHDVVEVLLAHPTVDPTIKELSLLRCAYMTKFNNDKIVKLLLADERVQKAKDLIPCFDDSVAKDVADAENEIECHLSDDHDLVHEEYSGDSEEEWTDEDEEEVY